MNGGDGHRDCHGYGGAKRAEPGDQGEAQSERNDRAEPGNVHLQVRSFAEVEGLVQMMSTEGPEERSRCYPRRELLDGSYKLRADKRDGNAVRGQRHAHRRRCQRREQSPWIRTSAPHAIWRHMPWLRNYILDALQSFPPGWCIPAAASAPSLAPVGEAVGHQASEWAATGRCPRNKARNFLRASCGTTQNAR